MKKCHQAIISVAFLTLFLSAGLNVGLPNYDSAGQFGEGKDKSQLISNSFEKADYGLWRKAIGKNAISSLISSKDFRHFLAARSAVRSGRYEEAITLTKNLEHKLKNYLGEIYLS